MFVELLVVIFIVAVLAALLLPALADRNHKHSLTAWCMSNQKQIVIGFVMWKSDHSQQFPWKVSTTNGGTFETSARGYAAPCFQCVSNYIRVTSVLVCPTDKNRIQATNFAQLGNLNVSYFVSLDSGNNAAKSILIGDRFLQVKGQPLHPGLFVLTTNSNVSWTPNFHAAGGVLTFADGHAEFTRDDELNSFIQNQPLATNHLCVP